MHWLLLPLAMTFQLHRPPLHLLPQPLLFFPRITGFMHHSPRPSQRRLPRAARPVRIIRGRTLGVMRVVVLVRGCLGDGDKDGSAGAFLVDARFGVVRVGGGEGFAAVATSAAAEEDESEECG